jgi:outer membrane protein OmpA-like peptidoglycan-associated protein
MLAAVVSSTAAGAEALSDEELLRLFQAQRDAFQAAAENPLGATRGLTLVTVDDVAAPTVMPTETQNETAPMNGAGPQVGTAPGEFAATVPGGEGDQGPGVAITGDVSPITADAGALRPLAPDAAPVTADAGELRPLGPDATPTPVVFGKLAPEMQVNAFITFDFDSAALRPDQAPKLAQLCSVMKSSDIALFRIVGHTDASGKDDYNERLSRLRAEEVQRHLVETCGIDPARLEAIGVGERFLFNEDDPRAGENRRVEFQALS